MRVGDICQVKRDKIQLLLNVINIENHQAILREFIVSNIYNQFRLKYSTLSGLR